MDPWRESIARGDFGAAWAVCDAVLERRRREGPPPHTGPRHEQWVWDGRGLDGRRVLVRCYHGLGDTLQFVRFLPALRARAREVTLWVQPALLGLLRSAAGVDRCLPLHDGEPDVEYDVELELMEVPHALRIAADRLPGPIPYLPLPASERARATHVDTKRVGLTWLAGTWDASRSLPQRLLARLATVPHVRWASLQFGEQPPSFATDDLARADVGEQAARMLDLDLVVTVDTVTAHLAGALGLPVWTLVPTSCDWRWAESGDRTRWYPTMRLFRQPSPGDWEGALTPLCDALAALAGQCVAGGEEFTRRPGAST